MIYWLDTIVLIYFASMNLAYGMLLLLSFFEILSRNAARMPEYDVKLLSDESAPPISILVPSYNEETGVVDSVKSLLRLIYSNLTIIVINDGSDDGTMQVLQDEFDLSEFHYVYRTDIETMDIKGIYQSKVDPRLLVVDKENGGKSDALNAGINLARTPLVCCIDSDTIIDRHAFLRMVEPFIFSSPPVIASGGSIRLANGATFEEGAIKEKIPKSWLARFQTVEYLRSFLFGRVGYNRLGGNMIISGAFGLFRRDALQEVGGYRTDTVGEDMEIVTRLHKHFRDKKEPYRVLYIPDPICYTEAPEKVKVLGAQRDRWQRGLADTLWRHKSMFLNPYYGLLGLVVFPIFVLFELLGPIIEFFGYFWFLSLIIAGVVDVPFTILFFLVAVFSGFLLSVFSLILNDLSFRAYYMPSLKFKLILFAFLENFGYRQLTLFFRIRGLLKFFIGDKTWGKMTRKGFQKGSA